MSMMRIRGPIAPEANLLTSDVLARHRFDWAHRLDLEEADRTLAVFPGRSFWVPSDDEVLIIGPWRHRMDIAGVAQVSAVLHIDRLIEAGRRASFDLGAAAFVMPDFTETRPESFYLRNGLQLLDEVISFEIPVSHVLRRPGDRLLRTRQVTPGDDSTLDAVVSIDHAAFPWLWRNSRLEFQQYLLSPGVEVWAFEDPDGAIVAYVGATSFAGWGHIDRIAVDPPRQGAGHGFRAVRFAIERLARLGARRVGLSTQRTNERSQRLYTGIGFRQTGQNDYRIYGTLATDGT